METSVVPLVNTAPVQALQQTQPIEQTPLQPPSDQLSSSAAQPTFCDLFVQMLREIWDWICSFFKQPDPPAPVVAAEPPKLEEAPPPPETPKSSPHKVVELPEECIICNEALHIPVELDCGHVLGQDCALEVTSCPMCRSPISSPLKIREDLLSKDLVELTIQGVPGSKAPPITLKVPPQMPVSAIKKIAYRTFFPEETKTGQRIDNTHLLQYQVKGTFWNSWQSLLGDAELQAHDSFDRTLKTHTLQLIMKVKGGTPIESCDTCFKNTLNCRHINTH